jgi:hypothetical protein
MLRGYIDRTHKVPRNKKIGEELLMLSASNGLRTASEARGLTLYVHSSSENIT